MLSPEFKCEFEGVLESAKKLPPNEAFDSCVQIIDKYNIAYDFEGHCDQFMVHEENRSKLMLSAAKCHETGEKIHFAGADLQELRSAFAFELSKLANRRKMQVEKNKALIKRSDGLLSDLTGRERFVTVGCSHISQFCKHAASGHGKTCRIKLQDPETGQLDVAKLKRNRNYKVMLEKGWKWKIFPSELDEAYPSFAKLAQRALNSSNNCRQELGEIELACQMVAFHAVAAADGQDDPKQAALDAVQENISTCQGYSKTLLDYAMEYGGGSDLPWLRFVDELGKDRSASKMLGSAFWNTLFNMKFWTANKADQKAGTPRPLVRLSLLCLQSSMPDSRDGIKTFVTETDLRKVQGKPVAPLVDELEAMIEEAFSFTSVLDSEMFSSLVQPIGHLLMRSALMMVDKEKKALDAKKKTVNQIKQLYLEDVSNVIGKKVEYEPWSNLDAPPTTKVNPAPEAATASKKTAAFKQLSDFTNVESQASKLGYNIGDFIYEKKFENVSENWYIIIDMPTKDVVMLQKAFNYDDADLHRIKVSFETLIGNWAVKQKPDMPRIISDSQIRPNALDIDKVRSCVFQELLKADNAATKDVRKQGIVIWTNPLMVRSSRAIPSGELILLPIVPLGNISPTNNKERTLQQVNDDPPIFIVPVSKPHVLEGKDMLVSDQLAAAYWLISTTSKADDGNMQEIIIEKGGFSFKALTNSKDIEPFVHLQIYKEAKKADKRQLDGAIIVSDEAAKRRKSGKVVPH